VRSTRENSTAEFVSFESERFICLETAGLHSAENRHLRIQIVIHHNAIFASMTPQRSANILNNFPLERNWEGEEKSIDSRTVESLA
jgi:hypothetical protein